MTGCNLPTGFDHPVSPYSPTILSLSRMNWITDSFWIELSKSSHPQTSCGLRSNILYHVQKNSSKSVRARYKYVSYASYAAWSRRGTQRGVASQDFSCRGHLVILDESSYGFATCEEGKRCNYFLYLSMNIQLHVAMSANVYYLKMFVFISTCRLQKSGTTIWRMAGNNTVLVHSNNIGGHSSYNYTNINSRCYCLGHN